MVIWIPFIFCAAENLAGVVDGVATGGGAGGVGVVGGVVLEGIVMTGELEDVLPPPPQDDSNTQTASALN